MYRCSKKLIKYKEYSCFGHSDFPAHLYLIYTEVPWVLVSSETQVQPQIILDPDHLRGYLFVSDDYEITMITRQMTPFFFICSSSSIRWYISFLHFKTFKIQFCGVPFLHYVLVCKIHIYMQKMTLSSLLTQISFFYIKLANFLYITCSISYLIPIWPQSHGLYF